MRRWMPWMVAFTVVYFVVADWVADHVPELTRAEAAALIGRAPEFHRYARLVRVRCFGEYSFQYRNAPAGAPTMEANARFADWDGAWPGPHPMRDFLLFRAH